MMAPKPDIYSGMVADLEEYTKPGRQSTVLKGKIFADHKLLPLEFIIYRPQYLQEGDTIQFELDSRKQPINIRKIF